MSDAGFCKPCACTSARKRLASIEAGQKKLPFAKAAYEPVDEIDGFKNISNDRAKLAQYGLDPKDLTIPGTAFRAVVYEKGPSLIVAFKGTDPTSWSDLKADVVQGIGLESQYYTRAQEIAKTIQRTNQGVPMSRNPPEFVGHSLGGGLASAAAAATGAPATTFNAAGLHARNVGEAVAKDVHAYKVRGEFLTGYLNKSRVAPDIFASDVTELDPKPGFGRDVVLPVLGTALGGGGGLGAALAARSVMLHLTPAIDDSLAYEHDRAKTMVETQCR